MIDGGQALSRELPEAKGHTLTRRPFPLDGALPNTHLRYEKSFVRKHDLV